MFAKLARGIRSMDLEEKILHAAVLVTAIGIFFPWFQGNRFCVETMCGGFSFFTRYIGIAIFLIQGALLAITFTPILGGPVLVRKSQRNYARLILTGASLLLLLAALTVLISVFSEDSGATIRFGIYLSLIGSVVSVLYAFLRYQEQVRSQVHELFHHPEDAAPGKKDRSAEPEELPPPPPAVPPPPPAEDHHLLS